MVKSSYNAIEDSSLTCSRDVVGRFDCHFPPSWPSRCKSDIVCRRQSREWEGQGREGRGEYRWSLGLMMKFLTAEHISNMINFKFGTQEDTYIYTTPHHTTH